MSTDFEETLRAAMHRTASLAPPVGDLAARTRQARARQRVRRTALAAGAGLGVVAAAAAAVLWLPPGALPVRVPAASGGSSGIAMMTADAPTDVSMDAALDGTLAVGPGQCLAVRAVTGAIRPVIWPYGWSATRDDDGRALLYDRWGREVAREGDAVELGGGLAGPTAFADHPCTGSEPFLAGPDPDIRR